MKRILKVLDILMFVLVIFEICAHIYNNKAANVNTKFKKIQISKNIKLQQGNSIVLRNTYGYDDIK